MDRIEWYGADNQVILQSYEGKTTLESFMNIASQSSDMLQSVTHPVQVIVDRSNAFFAKFEPTKLKPLSKLVPDNQDLVIVVGAHYNVEMLSNIVGPRVAPRAFKGTYYVSTMEEAHAILKRERNIDIETSA